MRGVQQNSSGGTVAMAGAISAGRRNCARAARKGPHGGGSGPVENQRALKKARGYVSAANSQSAFRREQAARDQSWLEGSKLEMEEAITTRSSDGISLQDFGINVAPGEVEHPLYAMRYTA